MSLLAGTCGYQTLLHDFYKLFPSWSSAPALLCPFQRGWQTAALRGRWGWGTASAAGGQARAEGEPAGEGGNKTKVEGTVQFH